METLRRLAQDVEDTARKLESYLDIDTTIAHEEGSTSDGAGSNPNSSVPGQSPQDAGKPAINHSVNADRIPGELPDDVETVHGSGIQESKMQNLQEKASTVGLYPGCMVKITDIKTCKVAERHAQVIKVDRKEVTVQGGEVYSQDKYKFLRLA